MNEFAWNSPSNPLEHTKPSTLCTMSRRYRRPWCQLVADSATALFTLCALCTLCTLSGLYTARTRSARRARRIPSMRASLLTLFEQPPRRALLRPYERLAHSPRCTPRRPFALPAQFSPFFLSTSDSQVAREPTSGRPAQSRRSPPSTLFTLSEQCRRSTPCVTGSSTRVDPRRTTAHNP